MPASGPHDAAALDGAALTNAAERLLTRGTAIGDIDRVRRAVALSESVLATTRPGSANHTAASANAARALIAEYEMTGRAGALDRAVRLLDSTDPDSGLLGDRGADFFSILGHALLRDTERTGLPDTAERAVAARRKARELTSREDNAFERDVIKSDAIAEPLAQVQPASSALTSTRTSWQSRSAPQSKPRRPCSLWTRSSTSTITRARSSPSSIWQPVSRPGRDGRPASPRRRPPGCSAGTRCSGCPARRARCRTRPCRDGGRGAA